MIKQIFLHPDMIILCTTLSSVKFSQINYGVNYRFMDMTFAKIAKGAKKNRQRVKHMYAAKIDEDEDRQYNFVDKEELCAFVENRTKQLMQELQEEETPDVETTSVIPAASDDFPNSIEPNQERNS